MICPHCTGRGTTEHSWFNCGGRMSSYSECETCRGVGAVTETSTWVPKTKKTCGACNGSGKREEEYAKEFYPSGKVAAYGKRKITCKFCDGRGAIHGGGYYHKTHKPDYSARKGGGGGCFITSACLAASPGPEAERVLETFRSFRDTYVLQQPDGYSLVFTYYQLAPRIVDSIERTGHAQEIYMDLNKSLVEKCYELIARRRLSEALGLYQKVFLDLQERFLAFDTWVDGSGI